MILPFHFAFLFLSEAQVRKLKPISFSLRQTPQPLHWGLNGFHSSKTVRMATLLGYLGSLRSTSCCQLRSQRFWKQSDEVVGALLLLEQHQHIISGEKPVSPETPPDSWSSSWD